MFRWDVPVIGLVGREYICGKEVGILVRDTEGVPGAREQFSTVILARVSPGMWQRLAPIVDPAPTSSLLSGRIHVVQDGDAHPAQVPLMTDAEAADWLTATAAGEICRASAHTTGPGDQPCQPRGPVYGVVVFNDDGTTPSRLVRAYCQCLLGE
ncbi:hypothetical protein [Streptomyces luteogriseus]|uniref:hypothetical protein n=1 Tax=Streptomyces luteogriseus TaxID=68233 RepID=UPI00379E58DE